MAENTIKLTVRGYHLDGYNHVNNARYLEFLEEARWQYFDNLQNHYKIPPDVLRVVLDDDL
jgi:acyl-CoA thioesterase FadM